MRSKFILVALFLSAAAQIFCQSAPAARESVWQVDVGAGASGYHTDFFGAGTMYGTTAWVDVYPNRGPRLLQGLGLALEGRDLVINPPASQPTLREDTGGGGAIYSWRHFKNFTPFGKYLYEQGSVDFNLGVSYYKHDDRSLNAFDGGFDYRITRHISVRADYEEQFWQRLFVNHAISTANGLAMRPRGVTVGAVYEFDHIHWR
jgi:Outer membrane protein beta-barrel domain